MNSSSPLMTGGRFNVSAGETTQGIARELLSVAASLTDCVSNLRNTQREGAAIVAQVA